MVTGATWYVAGQLVKKLLEEGLTVRAPVRDPNNPEKRKYLNEIAAATPGDIRFFKANRTTSVKRVVLTSSCAAIYGDTHPIPRKALAKWLVWLIGPIVDKTMTRKIIARNIDLPWKGDNSRVIRELGVRYRPLAESMNDFFQ